MIKLTKEFTVAEKAVLYPKKIFYLAQKITGIESLAYQQAVEWVYKLRRMGINVFSPALHSIPYHDTAYGDKACVYDSGDECVAEAHGYVCSEEMKARSCPFPKEDYAQWDFDLLECMLARDGYLGMDDIHYDSRLHILMAPTAYIPHACPKCATFGVQVCDDKYIRWDSVGCKGEYIWARDHIVHVFELMPFLQGQEVELLVSI
jgi:hypothetical protein